MKKIQTLKQKIIFYVMAVSILLSVLIIAVMSIGSIRSTNAVVLDNMQITTRIASQNISSNLHLLTERMHNLALESVFSNPAIKTEEKQARLNTASQQIEFVWLASYDLQGQKLYGDDTAPDSISDTGYYSDLTTTGNIVIGDPYYDNEILQLCVGAPLKEKDEITGYLIGSYKYDLLNDVLSLLILGNTGSSCILNRDGTIVGDLTLQNIIDKKTYQDLYPSAKNNNIWTKILGSQTGSSLMRLNHQKNYVGYAPIPGTNWTLFVHAPQMEFMGTVLLSLLFCIVLSILLLLTARFLITPVSEKISASLAAATKRLQALANGNLTEEVSLSASNDETRVLTQALSQTIMSLNHYIQTIQTCLGALSQGDYTIEIPDNFTGDFSSIKDSLTYITNALNQTMLQMNQSSIEVNHNSNEVSDCAKQLHDGSMNQSALLMELEQSMTAINSSIEKNRENVSQIEACSKNAAEKTSLGDNYMQSMLDTMEQIHSAVDEISQISRLIEEISDQTNLLSLNASIEAARAGDAGRGFAIVASEIGQLSKQTSDALQKTGNIVSHAVTIIQQGLHTAKETATAFHEIQEVTEQYLEISDKLLDTVTEQTSAVTYVDGKLTALKDIIEENRHLAEETNKMAADSLEQSENLKNYVSQVKIKNNILTEESL